MTLIDLEFNIEDVKDSFEPVPPDNYIGKIVYAKLGKSSNNNPMIKIRWEIISGEYAGRLLFDNVVTTVDWKVKQYADIIGVTSGANIDSDDFLGAEGVLTVVADPNAPSGNSIKSITAAA